MKRKQQQLAKAHQRFLKKASKKGVLAYFLKFMPEMIYRTTKLEGEKVTRAAVQKLFE